VIETLGARPAHIVGLSKGGGIALELAVRRPEFARSLVLIGPLVPDFPLSPGLTGQFRALAAGIRGRGTQDALRSLWMSHPLIAPAAATPGVRERLEAMFGTFPAGEYFASRRDPPDRDWTLIERLAAIAAPILVLRGERDIPEFAAMAAFLAERVPGAALEVVPSCGHLVPLEEPAETSRAVLRFLRSAPADCTGVRP
jgi:pimeloyl-ACP methyl ester carboxylesterase